VNAFAATTRAGIAADAATSPLLGRMLVVAGPNAAAAIAPAVDAAGGLRRGSAPGLAWALDGAARIVGNERTWICGLADLVAGDLREAPLGDGRQCCDWRGRFAFARYDSCGGEFAIATDHFATLGWCWLQADGHVFAASDATLLLPLAHATRVPDPVAVFHLLNFGQIPAPHTIDAAIRRLGPGSLLRWQDGRATITRYWRPTYAEDLQGTVPDLARDLRERIVAAVQRYRPEGADWGCFLSGGTDSSSITSILARQDPSATVRTYSIGFAEPGYDELGFAGIAARACGAEPVQDRVDERQAVAMIPAIVDLFDQPFGNASAVPTLGCTRMARAHGAETLLAGDGGDEIFGGNARYAKDRVMQAFHRSPNFLRAGGRALAQLARGSSRLGNRVANFVRRASLPNPDRFYTDDSFGSDHFAELFRPATQSVLAQGASLDLVRKLYTEIDARDEVNRLMGLDLELAIARNDLIKVHGAARGAGLSVRFPYLDIDLVEYAGRLPGRMKVRGITKRYLFKQAMAGILPPQVLRKKKQGFGLPIGVWLARPGRLQDLAREVVLGERARARGWFEPAFVARLFQRHVRGEWDYAAPIWHLLVLELWLQRHLDRK
jgi:asparagine synthase (glutamine-hydrolysing)